ncbi:16S rRNA processing protein RimM [Richelia intracellularis HH01]|jgi:16S rRNA processing protein RimM|uniref:Ribosome maturation factor RimM n=1 Tax=Richelia intracellularis HH01 TaxID=1165094 RepID=M1WSG7_9NOST|nr:ribosome maturation factor RimM [Richelia intracellularis]CCH67449.1 16S rRNA processing protein RimM [Richelia intracellularis HH01]HAE05579.1 ribosome maturation factor RimM [Richelia sp.]
MSEWIEIGKIVAPYGLHGEMRVYPKTDFPERFENSGNHWLLRPKVNIPTSVELLYVRYLKNKELYIIKLQGVENREQAEEIRGSKLLVLASDRPVLEDDEYHVLDLIGMPVYLKSTGDLIGEVVDVIIAGHNLLEVEPTKGNKRKSTKNILIPFVKEITPVVDLPSRRIEITPPPGLLDINQ